MYEIKLLYPHIFLLITHALLYAKDYQTTKGQKVQLSAKILPSFTDPFLSSALPLCCIEFSKEMNMKAIVMSPFAFPTSSQLPPFSIALIVL
jgi:hypothetical protein